MKVLIIGSGGREHALVKALRRSGRVSELLAAPGSSGIAQDARCCPVSVEDIPGLLRLAQAEEVGLTIVGPELPLTLGVVDAFQAAGLRIFGPTQAAAILEASKVFTKNFLKKYRIPTARYEIFSEAEVAKQFLRDHAATPWVLKADGLAAGKGVLIPLNLEEALAGVERILVRQEFGKQQLLIEEFLDGEELSFMVLCDGVAGLALASSQDHKRLNDGDLGPNTGGMGAYSPAPLMTEELSQEVMRTIIAPTLAGMREEGRPFVGVLYAGLMIVKGKPYVLEYNVRFGDPEAEVLLPRLESDWMDLFEAAIEGRISQSDPKWRPGSAVCVVISAEGYPAAPSKGDVISGLEQAGAEAIVYHAGTVLSEGTWLTNGGRVLAVTALGKDLETAVRNAYAAISRISFRGMHYRRDIAARGVNKINSA
ncbi:MAG TPA: phosphoribosylamine--glycine ligase [Deltaproteobacteria bacterium]|nr:phosphoribosylamine--glycine ligase [Deltaproteobacteria bacterium]